MGDATLHLCLLERSFNQQTAQASPCQQLNSEDNSHSEQHADCLSAQKLKSLLEWLLAVESKLVGLGVKVTNNRVEQPDSLVSERVLLLAESLKTELSSSPISQNYCDPGQDSLQLNQDAIHKSSPLKPLQDLSNVDNKENSCVNRAPPKSWNQQFDKSTIATQEDLPEKVVQQLRESATRLLELEGTILTLEQELQETKKRLKETSEDSSKIIEDLKSFNSDLNANLSLKSTECLDLLKCLENRSEELIVLQQKVEANESASLRMSQEFDELKKIAGSSEVRILELEGSVSDLQTVLTQTRDNWSQLVRSSCSYLDELSKTKRVLELNSVAGRVEMSEKLEAVESHLLKMEQSVLQLTTEGNDHKATILSKDGIIDNLQQENTKLAGEIENLRLLSMQMESLETELTIAKESFAKLKSDHTESLDKIGRLNTELLAAADEKTRLARLLEDAENKLADSSALDEAKETILKMSSELDSARLTILELKEKMPPENVFNTPSSFKPARHGQKATPAQMVSSNSTSTTPMSSRSSAQLDESTLDSYVRSTDETSRHEVSCVVPVEFERSVFVADLLTDRTLCGVDPLSMTVGNGEFLDVASYSSDDSEFATPVANRSHRNSPLKKLAANQVFPESVELMEKLKNYKDELQLLQEERDQLSQSCETTKLMLDNICETIDKTFLVLQDDIPDLAVDQKLAILADKISSLARTVKGSTVSSQVNLTSAVELLVEDRLRTASFHAGILDHLHYGSKVLRDECGSIKDSFLQLNSTLNQNIEEVVSSFGDMNNSYQQLMKQLADQTNTVGDLRVATESSSNEIVRLTQELDSVQKELKDASEGNSALERKLIESESLCANLIVEKGSVVESKKDLEQKVLEFIQSWTGDFSLPACLNDVWESVILEVLSLKKSADALKATLEKEEISSVVKTIKNECIKLRGEAASSQKDVEASLAKATEVLCMLVDELRSQEGLRVELSTMEEQLKGCQERISQFQSTIEESNSSCESLGKNLKILEEENQALRRANGSLEKVLQESATDAKENDRLKMENEKLSADIAKFKETVTDLNDRLTACQSQLEVLHERSDQHCGTCSSHESDLKSVTSALTSLVVSTANQPIDLTCQLENACDIILFTNNVLEKSNVIISTILRSLNLTEMSGLDALESIHDRLNQSEIEDAVMCKKKMCEEICGLDADVDKRELVTLSLVELQSKLVSLIMEKEVHLINDYQMRYDKQIASLDEELKCLVEKEKRTNEYNQHLLKECENLERTLSSYQTNANPTQQNNLLSSPKKDVPGRRNDEDRQSYANEIRALKNQIELLEKNFHELKSSSSKEIVELKGFLHRLVECLESFLDRTDASESLDLNVESFPLAGQNSVVDNLRRLLSEIFEKFSQHKALICDLKKISEDQVETIERLNDCVHNLTEQRDNCSSAAAAVQASLLENKELLKSKEDCIRAMEKERIDIQTQLEDLKASLQSKEAEVVDLKNTMESELAKNLADHQRNVADLRNRALSDGLFKVSSSFKGLSKHLALTKDEVMHLQQENGNNISGIVSGINGQVARFVDSEREKLAAGFDAKISHLHQDLKVLKDDKNQLISEKLKLEKSIHELENEKDAMSKRLKESSEVQVVVGHDEDTCPYREKVTELKKEVYIARQRVEEEKRKFDVTKVNMAEELAMKCSSIAELESRIETTTNEFKQRLATVTVSYNQKCVELERCEATVSLLRDMNAQDKQSLEKELDSLAKELARLQSARKFVEELGVDVSSDSIAALKKKLSNIDELTKEVEELKEKNADLDSECEFMNKEIQFLEVRNGETYKECVEKTERLENLEKEHKQELAELSKRLETELDRAKQLAIQSQNELSAQLADVRNRLAAQAEANVQLQNAYSQLEHSLETCNKKILIYLNRIRDLEQTIMEKNKSIEEMKQALDTQQVEYAQLCNQKICSQESLAAMESEMIRLQQTLQQTNAEIESMRRVVENATQVEASSIQRIQAGLPINASAGLCIHASAASASVPRPAFASMPRRGFASVPRPAFASVPQPGFPSVPRPAFASMPRRAFASVPRLAFASVPRLAFASVPRPAFASVPRPTFASVPVWSDKVKRSSCQVLISCYSQLVLTAFSNALTAYSIHVTACQLGFVSMPQPAFASVPRPAFASMPRPPPHPCLGQPSHPCLSGPLHPYLGRLRIRAGLV
ncbi:unnamed protein product [Nesidiocoris tenuis]|uniref:Uncharacterized protein n=1 Tax=Nesidiocoris tenuis TaxID=355587 RepID=A0A6H5HC78_9HEMI|nr:unnamed protein product [Nesidiocoris tenuis]